MAKRRRRKYKPKEYKPDTEDIGGYTNICKDAILDVLYFYKNDRERRHWAYCHMFSGSHISPLREGELRLLLKLIEERDEQKSELKNIYDYYIKITGGE